MSDPKSSRRKNSSVPFKIRDADIFIDVKSFDLVKLRAVRGIHFIAPISRAGSDDANRRRRASIVRICTVEVCVRSNAAVGQIKCVLFVSRRMIGRGVERVEAMPFGLDIRSFGESETHSPKNSDRAIEHLGERMERAELGCGAGE